MKTIERVLTTPLVSLLPLATTTHKELKFTITNSYQQPLVKTNDGIPPEISVIINTNNVTRDRALLIDISPTGVVSLC